MNTFEVKRRWNRPSKDAGLFLCLMVLNTLLGPVEMIAEVAEAANSRSGDLKVLEELSVSEKRELVGEFIKEGDAFFQQKDYDRANASYERVFLLEANNQEASKRIDAVKKQMLAEGKKETELVTGMYDAEIDARVHYYWKRAQVLVEQKRWGEARLTLEKILLLNPLHKDAGKLYQEVKLKSGAK